MANLLSTGSMSVTPLSTALGARIANISLTALDQAAVQSLHDAVLQYGVLVFPDQGHLSIEELAAFAGTWGEVDDDVPVEFRVPGSHAVIELDSKGGPAAKDIWHMDVTMKEIPPRYAMHLVRTATLGGDTIFANQCLAYESLSEELRRMLGRLRSVHVLPPWRMLPGAGTVQSAVHPTVRTHPETGRNALYVNEMYTTRFDGMTEEESRPILSWLFAHGTQPEFTYRHHWSLGDLVLWDCAWMQHYVVSDYGGAQRVMHRVSVKGEPPRYREE